MKSRELIPGVLSLLALFGFSLVSKNFFDASYLLSNFTIYVETGLLALGMTFVIISGNIDLSVGSNMVLTGCLTAKLLAAGIPAPVAIVFAIVSGTLLGAINGLFVAKLKLPSFLVTLGTMAVYRGAAQAMLGASSVKVPPSFIGVDTITFALLPMPVWGLLVATLVTGLILHRTVLGRRVLATGTNETAALYAGIPVDRLKIVVFALTGLLAGVASLLLISRLGVARHDLVRGIELDAITAVVVGGTSIFGGRGSIIGSLFAVILVALIKTGMGVANVKAEYQLTAIGILLIVSALIMNLSEVAGHLFKSRQRLSAKPTTK